MGLSMKDFFVASGLNIQREMHDVAKRPFFSQDNKECTVCIFKFLKALSSVSLLFLFEQPSTVLNKGKLFI